jgi:AraC-like DNA-binding protein
MARPKLKIDENLVKKLANVGCSNESIAIQVGCSTDTLTRRFAELLSKSRENLRTQLRIWQLDAARKGNVTMQIWLGKQILGQTEKIEEKVETVQVVKYTLDVSDDTNPVGFKESNTATRTN